MSAIYFYRFLPYFRNCENMISIAGVEELIFRQSRLCRKKAPGSGLSYDLFIH